MIPPCLIPQEYNRNVMRDRPVLYMPNFGPRPSGAASDQAVDQSGNGNNGTFSGGYTLGQPGPFAGARGALILGSPSGGVEVPSSSSLSPTTGFTLETWVAAGGGGFGAIANNYACVFRKEGSYALVIIKGTNTVLFGNFVDTNLVTTGAIPDSGHQYLVATYSQAAGLFSVFINGKLSASCAATSAVPVNTNAVSLGYSIAYSDEQYTGGLALAAIYNYALSPSRIAFRWQIAHGIGPSKKLYTFGSGAVTAKGSMFF